MTRRVLTVLGVVLAVYLIGRAIAEPFIIDLGDPATYRQDWGGPHLAGVLAVHMLPGVLSAGWLFWLARRRSARPPTR